MKERADGLPDYETAEFVGKVKDRNMGYLFENMKKIDIQAERRRADKTERSFIETLQELGQSREFVTLKIIEKWDMDEKDAEEIVKRYWK